LSCLLAFSPSKRAELYYWKLFTLHITKVTMD